MRPHEIDFSTFEGGIFTDLMPFQYGREVCAPAHAFGPARRSHFLFHYILSGSGTFNTTSGNGERTDYPLEAGEGFLIFPTEITAYVADMGNPWEYIWIEFDGSQVKSVLDRLGMTPSNPIYRSQDDDARDDMVAAMRALLSGRGTSPLAHIAQTYRFLDGFSRSAVPYRTSQTGKLHGYYVDSALEYISERYRSDIGVEDIARHVGLNRSYFGKVFKNAMGVSPQQFLIGYRMEKAADLLKLSALSVAEVGRSVGYPNQLHFSRAFKSVHGISPRAWRREHAGNVAESSQITPVSSK